MAAVGDLYGPMLDPATNPARIAGMSAWWDITVAMRNELLLVHD